MPGEGFEPSKALSHRILSPAPLTARESRHTKKREKQHLKNILFITKSKENSKTSIIYFNIYFPVYTYKK